MKNKLLKVLSLSLLVSSFSLVSCDSKDDPKNEVEPIVNVVSSITLNESNILLTLGDTSKLIARTSNDIDTVLWTSTNEDVASVDSEGNVIAKNVGQTSIIASNGDTKDSCLVTVTSGDILPTINFVNGVAESNNVCVNSTLNLATFIAFNNKTYFDHKVSYEVSNNEAGTVDENGLFHSSNKIGETTRITIKATWKNFDSPSLIKVIDVKIITLKSVLINNGEVMSFNLSTVNKLGDLTFTTSQVIDSINAYQDGEEKEIQDVELINNVSSVDAALPCASLEFNSSTKKGLVTALRAGTASLKVTYLDNSNAVSTQLFDVKVTKPIVKIEKVISNFSILDGKFVDEDTNAFTSLTTLFPVGSTTIENAYQGDTSLNVNADKVLGVTSTKNDGFSLINLKVFNELVGIDVTVSAATKVLVSAEDFKDIYAQGAGSNKEVRGYFYLHNDITSGTLVMPEKDADGSSFAGVFDGAGHKVTVSLVHPVSTSSVGLFGKSLNGLIKNTAFVSCTSDAFKGGFIADVGGAGSIIQDSYLNAFVSYGSGSFQFATFRTHYGPTRLTRVLFNNPLKMNEATNNGILGIHKIEGSSKDIIFVSHKDNNIGYCDGYKLYLNDNEKNADSSIEDGKKHAINCGAVRFESFSSLKSSRLNYSNYPSDIWDTSSGVPVFKGCDYYK